MTDKICVPRIDKLQLDKFVRKTKVEHYRVTTWFGWTDLDTDGLFIPVKYKGKHLYIRRTYHKWNYPVAWDLQLDVVDRNDVPFTDIPKLTFSTYFWIESDVNDEENWRYDSMNSLKWDLLSLMWDIAEPKWNEMLTNRLNRILNRLFANEIDHQIERFQSDIDELISKYNAGELVAEV